MDIIALLRVLLLEDSPLDADLIVDWLHSDSFDCHVECVQTREDYVAALHDGQFDLLLSDYSLPGFDGMAALSLAQSLRPRLPFIFVSGYLGEELAIETLKRGATDYVLKGRLERLLPSVERALREAQERDARHRIETMLHILSEASLVLSSLDYATTLSHVARLAVPHFADYCVVDVVAEDGCIERVAAAHANAEAEPLVQQLLDYVPAPDSNHPLWKVLNSGKSQLLTSFSDSTLNALTRDAQHAAIVRQLGISSSMIVPLLAEGRTLGVMSLVSATPERSYGTLDLSLAEDLARRCAMAVENARLHRKTLDALRARDEFLAVLSHELRTPLTAIMGWIHLLKTNEVDDDTQAHGLEVIERNTKMQAQLIEDLLEVSRIITGRLRLAVAPVELDEIVQNVITSLAPTWEAKGVEVRFAHHATDNWVRGDAPRLQQIVANLLSNAIKFTPSGGHVEVALDNKEGQVCLTMKDSGEGIAPEFMPYVFDRFRQADSSSTRNHGGLGLGLSIVRHLTEIHGGTINAFSSGLGHGAAFIVSLPLMSAAPSSSPLMETSPRPQPDTHDTVALSGVKILLVEDSDDTREVLVTMLRGLGAQVTPARSTQEAISALRGDTPDVIISDIAMPDEDGYALIRHVKEWEAKHHAPIPVMALTAHAGEHDRLQALSAGFAAYLTKPVEPNTLAATIADLARRTGTPRHSAPVA